MSILIVTYSEDHEGIDLVASELVRLGHEVMRLDTDRYPQEVTVSTRYEGSSRRRLVRVGHETISLEDCTAVWYRRFRAGEKLFEAGLGDQLDGAYKESRQTLWGTIASLPVKQMNPWQAVRLADFKEVQTDWALDEGLKMPRTLFSNDPAQVRDFYADLGGRMVAKMQSNFTVVRQGDHQVVYTSPVTAEDLASLDGLRYAPMIFQEQVDKRLDARVIVIGDELYGACVDPGDELDWRKEGETLMPRWTPWEVPREVRGPLLGLMGRLGLCYGAADFVVTPDGECLFLEVNASGEWLWLEQQAGLPLSAALARFLAGR
ncbi:MAG: ATP-grasp ribosomal peptide maturase [Candidatus Xenobia bacterium]